MKRSTTNQFGKKFSRALIIPLAVVVGLFSLNVNDVFADNYDDQIAQLQNEVRGYQQEAGRLRAEADTLQNVINSLNAQKQAIQAQIDLSQAKLDKLKADIEINEKKLERQKKTINKTVAQIYANGSTTPIEMVASSKNVGEYVSSQAVRGSVQTQLKQAMDEVKELKAELVKQKADVEKVIADQSSQRNELAAKEAEQAELLAQTQGQEANYQALVSDANNMIGQLRAQQAAQMAATRSHAAASGLNIVAGDPSRGGYPSYLADPPLDSVVDDWGMYNRECVSYTAWKVYQKNGYMQHGGGRGHAYQWPSTYSNYSQGGVPRAQSVVVWNQYQIGGGYGHVAWVERVNSDGSILVSQYNYGTPGAYSEMTVRASQAASLWYIYF